MDPIIRCGLPAPDFTLPDLDGQQYHLAQARGSLLIINFWSAECPWSERFDGELHIDMTRWGEGVKLWNIAANANEAPEILRQVAAQRNLQVILPDIGAKVADLYGAQTTPHVFLVDKDGILRYQGAVDDRTFRQRVATRFYLREAVDALRSGSQPDPEITPAYGCVIVRKYN